MYFYNLPYADFPLLQWSVSFCNISRCYYSLHLAATLQATI
jgi:hypothetical protein